MQIENHKEEVPFAHYEELFRSLQPQEAAQRVPGVKWDGKEFYVNLLGREYGISHPDYAIRAVDVAAQLEEVDAERLVTWGGSQGGALSIVASALSGRICKCYTNETSYCCIHRRIELGMIEEVKGLLDAGVSEEYMIKLGLEYKFVTQYLRGDYSSLEEMKALLATAIKQFAKRQMTWFRRDQDIHWLAMDQDPIQEASRLIQDFLS